MLTYKYRERSGTRMLKRIGGTLGAIAGAAGAHQFPAFYAMYVQHYAGRTNAFRESAEISAHPEIISRAESHADNLERLVDAAPIEDLFVFLTALDPVVVQDVLDLYTATFVVNWNMVPYTAAGLLVGAASGAMLGYLGERAARGQ